MQVEDEKGVGRRSRPSLQLPSLNRNVVGYPSGQRGQTVNLLAHAFDGSNPSPTTISAESEGTSAESPQRRGFYLDSVPWIGFDSWRSVMKYGTPFSATGCCPNEATRVHPDRVAGGHRHHRDPCRHALTGLVARKNQGTGCLLHEQPSQPSGRMENVRGGRSPSWIIRPVIM